LAAIFTINPDGTGERQLTHPPRGTWTSTPNWSPDGRWIVYSVFRNADQDDSRIWMIRANGSHRTRLDGSCTSPCLTDEFPTWSPSGKQIAFERGMGPSVGENNLFAIIIMRVDGSHVRQITQVGADPTVQQPYEDLDPSWSPDGRRIAFERVKVSTNRHAIFTLRLDGYELRRLTPWKLDAASPDWSPGGGWIAFRKHESSGSRGDIGLVRPTGKHLHLITSGRGKRGLLTFSPDGLNIAASWSADGVHFDIYSMRLDGTDVRSVVHTSKPEGVASWGPVPA
jgi:TolB protein